MNIETIARYELKYAVPPELAGPIRAFIRPYCMPDPHGRPEKGGFYTIDSLYFDSDDYRMYWDTEDGAPVRAKLRVRTYPDAPPGVVKFEVKRRVMDETLKTSAVVPRAGWQDWLRHRGRGASLPEKARAALDAFVTMAQRMNARPKMLVRYDRQAFFGVVEDYVRLTFDRYMLHQPMRRYDLAGWPDHWTPMDDERSMGVASHLLLEMKFKNRAPMWMADLVRRFGLVRQGYSKYCSAVRRHVLESGACWDLMPALGVAPHSEAASWTC